MPGFGLLPPIAIGRLLNPENNLADFSTPGFNPNASKRGRMMPPPGPTSAPAPAPAPSVGPQLANPEFNPSPSMSAPTMTQPSMPPPDLESARAPMPQEIDRKLTGGTRLRSPEEEQFLRERGLIRPNDFSIGDRIKESLKSAGVGALQGLKTGSLTGALGGAIGSAGVGAYDPRLGARSRFATLYEPAIQAEKAQQAQQAQAQVGLEEKRADIELKKAQAARAGMLPPISADAPAIYDPNTKTLIQNPFDRPKLTEVNGKLVDNTGKVVYNGGDKPLTADEAEAERARREGSQESIAQSSLRGRLPSLQQNLLTPEERRFVNGGVKPEDDPRAVRAAQEKWDQIQQRELASIRRDTGERAKVNAEGIRRSGRPSVGGGQPGRAAISVAEAANLLKK